jgi:hypothetical protein
LQQFDAFAAAFRAPEQFLKDLAPAEGVRKHHAPKDGPLPPQKDMIGHQEPQERLNASVIPSDLIRNPCIVRKPPAEFHHEWKVSLGAWADHTK